MWYNGMPILFSKILNISFNIPKVLSIDIFLLNCIKFQCVLYFGSATFSPLKGN
jgi:hypothetical protein